MLWDRAGSPHKKREKRKRKTEQHKSPHTDAQPSSHQGPDLKSKSLLTGLYRGHWAGVKRMPPWQKSLLVGHWALSPASQNWPAFSSWVGRDEESSEILALLYLFPWPLNQTISFAPRFPSLSKPLEWWLPTGKPPALLVHLCKCPLLFLVLFPV